LSPRLSRPPPPPPSFPYTTLFRSRQPPIPGLTCYPDIESLPTAPDVGLVLLASDRAEDAVRALAARGAAAAIVLAGGYAESGARSEEHTSELQSLTNLVCRLLLEK